MQGVTRRKKNGGGIPQISQVIEVDVGERQRRRRDDDVGRSEGGKEPKGVEISPNYLRKSEKKKKKSTS